MVDRSTIRSVALDRLIAHRDNPNRMSSSNFAKLVRNIKHTGRYEPLIVRPYRKKPCHSRRGKAVHRHCESNEAAPRHRERSEAISSNSLWRDCYGPQSGPRNDNKHRASSIERRGRFQIINGYHRWQALKQLGYKRADVIVWDVDDEQADVLLATLNRLAGSDELSKKIALLKKLSKKMNARELAKLIPQTPGRIKRLVNLEIPKAPAKTPPDKFANPLVFFVTDEQKKIIEEAMLFARRHPVISSEPKAGRDTERSAEPGTEICSKDFSTPFASLTPVEMTSPLRGEGAIDPSAALGVTIAEHPASSPTKAEAKAETLTAVAQHFIDTILRGCDKNEDQVRPA